MNISCLLLLMLVFCCKSLCVCECVATQKVILNASTPNVTNCQIKMLLLAIEWWQWNKWMINSQFFFQFFFLFLVHFRFGLDFPSPSFRLVSFFSRLGLSIERRYLLQTAMELMEWFMWCNDGRKNISSFVLLFRSLPFFSLNSFLLLRFYFHRISDFAACLFSSACLLLSEPPSIVYRFQFNHRVVRFLFIVWHLLFMWLTLLTAIFSDKSLDANNFPSFVTHFTHFTHLSMKNHNCSHRNRNKFTISLHFRFVFRVTKIILHCSFVCRRSHKMCHRAYR